MTHNIRTISKIAAAIILVMTSVSCKDKGLIPKETMEDIYYDIYMTDATISDNRKLKRMADTLKVYEPIFNKYGYTADDFKKSMDEYLLRPDKFKKVFLNAQKKLEKRKAVLEAILAAEGKRFTDWSLADSLELFTMEGVHSANIYRYMRVIFFKPDTTFKISPIPDSTAANRIDNPLFLFTDSAYNADAGIRFYEITGIHSEVKAILEAGEKEKEAEEEVTLPVMIDFTPTSEHNRNLNILHRPGARKNAWTTTNDKDKSEKSKNHIQQPS